MATTQDLLAAVNGKSINTDGADNGQCTAIPHKWEEMSGWPIVLGNAKDTLANAPSTSYDKTYNAPTNYPLPGAIMVWGPTWGGGYGHTAVVYTANVDTFTCVEQNDGDNGLAHLGTHNYSGVEGWFTPDSIELASDVVTVKEIVNVRADANTTSTIVTQYKPGTYQVTEKVTGQSATVGVHTSDVWYMTPQGTYFNSAATM